MINKNSVPYSGISNFRKEEENRYLFLNNSGKPIIVNEIAKELLKLSDGNSTIYEISLLLSKNYDCSLNTILNDVLHFFDVMSTSGVVTIR